MMRRAWRCAAGCVKTLRQYARTPHGWHDLRDDFRMLLCILGTIVLLQGVAFLIR